MTLPVSRLVSVQVNLAPLAAGVRSFGTLLILGDSNVINGSERARSYDGIEGVLEDFSITSPEYLAANLYFSQNPRPAKLMIGRWLATATAAQLQGAILSASQQMLSNFTSVTSGGFRITVDGVLKSLTGLNFSSAINLNGVASAINTALTGATVVWNGSQFVVTSATTGVTSTITFATPPTSGADVSALLGLDAASALPIIPGYAAEDPVGAAAALANVSNDWYGLMFAASTQPTDNQSLAVSALIESLDPTRIYGVTIQNTNILSNQVTTDLASLMKAAAYRRSFNQYSSSSPYAVASLFGRAFSVNFNANRSTITLMFKQEPGVVAENLSTSQANTLQFKRSNVFTQYNNDTMIIQYGFMSGPAWFDEIHGLDWLQNTVQTACFNLLYTSTTKIPQTDAGMNMIANACQQGCDAAVNNGLVAPGTWTQAGFGQLKTGDFLQSGYYIYFAPLSTQSQGDREARLALPIQIAIKLAGAIQQIPVIINVNR